MSLLIAIYLTLVIALPLVLSGLVSYRTLPRSEDCPLCGTRTMRIRSRWLRTISLLCRAQEFQLRWCTSCLWEGAIRVARPDGSTTVSDSGVVARPAPVGPASPGRRPGREAVGLRELEVDGRYWQVLLQCWHDTDLWFGQLLFIEPSGRLWIDPVDPMCGTTAHEVLGQALALPDQTIACRLRESISD